MEEFINDTQEGRGRAYLDDGVTSVKIEESCNAKDDKTLSGVSRLYNRISNAFRFLSTVHLVETS